MKKILGVALCLALAACGGGGGEGASPPSVVNPPSAQPSESPKITLAFDNPKAAAGETAKLNWTVSGATSCEASGAWAGSQPMTGTSVFSASTPGQTPYTLTCKAADGTAATQTAYLMVPLPVAKTSYQNKANAAEAIGAQKLPDEVDGGNAVAFADFFQEGTYSMVTHSLEYDPTNTATASKFGHIHFWKFENSAWVDHTPEVLESNSGCLHPRKAAVADFNADGKPDVFFACHGFDAAPFAGEQPRVLMSQADGKYKNVAVPTTCFCHSASAADFSSNGYADVLVTDNIGHGKPYMLVNDKNGSFAEDTTRLGTVPMNSQIYTAELVDFDANGTVDAFLAGEESGAQGYKPTIISNDGTQHFTTDKVLTTDASFTTTLDLVFKNNAIYLNRVHINTTGPMYGFSKIEKVDQATNVSTTLYTNSANFKKYMSWINWIIPSDGKIESLNSDYGVSVAQ